MFEFKPYTVDCFHDWNRFVEGSKNGTFLFDRNYMDYHSDRFEDSSLMIWRKGRLFALLPANKVGETLFSHQGLTFGGLVLDHSADASSVLELFRQLNGYLYSAGLRKVVYKPVPYIYHREPAQEDLYALFYHANARICARNISSALYRNRRIDFAESRKSGLRKAKANGLSVKETDGMRPFYEILKENLGHKYDSKPVHSIEELELLKSRFPQNIRIFITCRGNEVLGGTIVFMMPPVVHTQYISASEAGKETGALDLLFDELINRVFVDCPVFDFGTSNESGGRVLNENLIFQKVGFGGRGVVYDTYEYELSHFK